MQSICTLHYEKPQLSMLITQSQHSREKLFGVSLALLYAVFWLQTTWPRLPMHMHTINNPRAASTSTSTSTSTVQKELDGFQQDQDVSTNKPTKTSATMENHLNSRSNTYRYFPEAQSESPQHEFCVPWEVNSDHFWTHK